MASQFVHLRLHSAYSLAESMLRIKKIATLAGADSQPAVAITDSQNMFGALEFSQVMMGSGVQPIVGLECLVGDARGNGETVLLAQNETGYAALCRLNSAALLSVEGGDDPVIPLESLASEGEGLILLTGGAENGFVARAAADGQTDLVRDRLAALAAALPGRVYVELQRHGLAAEQRAEPILLDAALETGLPLVATNDCRFETRDMELPHDVLVCIGEGRKLAEPDRRRFSAEHYFKTSAEMTELFADVPEAISNTVVIAKRCSVVAETRKPILPPFESESGLGEEDELRRQAEIGLEERLTRHVFADEMDAAARDSAATPYRERLSYELGVINQMGFPGYFLIVADFIQWAKRQDIPVGPGRGSGAGSVVAWALSITDLDPLRWGLLFERFLNPERISMPDFDVDFCQDRRDEVITYVQEKYGYDRVAQIITFGSLQARAALRDVGRVLEMPYSQVTGRKADPEQPGEPDNHRQGAGERGGPRQQRREDEQVAELIGVDGRGAVRSASTRRRPCHRRPPTDRRRSIAARSLMPVTQFNMKWVEEAGLAKFDFLGLKTPTVLHRAVSFRPRADRRRLYSFHDDEKTFEMLSAMTIWHPAPERLKPDRFEDIIAVIAYRQRGEHQAHVSVHDPSLVTPHPALEPVLAETHGIMIYQEQVQQVAQPCRLHAWRR